MSKCFKEPVDSSFFLHFLLLLMIHGLVFAAFLQVRVVSPDKDFFQILSPSLRLLRIAPRGFELVLALANKLLDFHL